MHVSSLSVFFQTRIIVIRVRARTREIVHKPKKNPSINVDVNEASMESIAKVGEDRNSFVLPRGRGTGMSEPKIKIEPFRETISLGFWDP